MIDAILTLNAGSSSLKAAAYRLASPPARILRWEAARFGVGACVTIEEGARRATDACALRDHGEALDALFAWLGRARGDLRFVAAGHRVAHGGPDHAGPARITPEVLAGLDALTPLAPLHLPHNLAAVRALAARLPALPQVACFDTGFHRTIPQVARLYALPRALADEGIVRYGFHGLSYEHVVRALPDLAGALPARLVALHLGHGASLAAIARGESVDTTMGLTPLDGVPMGTRPGALDPGVVLHLMQARGLAPHDLEDLLYRRSGLLGLSGVSAHVHELVASQDPRAAEALAVFEYRVAREIGALAAALGGLDAMVFTGGIGEHAADVRARIVDRCAWLGMRLDREANARHGPRISTASSAVSAWVIPCDEEIEIARQTMSLVFGPSRSVELRPSRGASPSTPITSAAGMSTPPSPGASRRE